ncbi:hypothetical protein JGU71_02235 [Antrihabitans sp. YC3-6]|uniref:DUF485 domain-containing protein n=1 Tax=Antrihabitans stalagmiti TaxID=2799499 RepID=A0A934U0J8_9NOCA|nr:hypothetical protein [Antrihabitans stalagmiti]MBJ8337695.1 hypothetical protein [Antrihabitans stalagmiti]
MSSPTGREPRQRVVLADRRGARMVRTRVEVQEQTAIGDALVRGLVRAQLGLAIRLALVVVCTLGLIPLLGAAFPAMATTSIAGIRVTWLALGVVAYPLLWVIGHRYVRLAERNEQDFADLVED